MSQAGRQHEQRLGGGKGLAPEEEHGAVLHWEAGWGWGTGPGVRPSHDTVLGFCPASSGQPRGTVVIDGH